MMKGRYHKLSPKFYGPYQIIARVGKVAYRLALPANSLIHLVFHVSKLKVHKGDNFSTQQALPKVDKDDVIGDKPQAVLGRKQASRAFRMNHDIEMRLHLVDNTLLILASKRTRIGTQQFARTMEGSYVNR
ncbi:hypothetical protein Tco_0646071 [Tanacetum coccineum]